MIDIDLRVFTRYWCLFELLRAVQTVRQLDLCTRESILNRAPKITPRGREIIGRLRAVDLESAQCTKESDRRMIRLAIESSIGFPDMERTLQRLVTSLYRIGEVETTLVDPIMGTQMNIMNETVPLRIEGVACDEAIDSEELFHRLGTLRRIALIAPPG